MDMPPDAASPPPRLTMPAFWHEVAEGMFNLERGLPWTFWRMLVAPGRLIRGFVVDRDPRIVRPVRYFLVCFSIAALVFGLVGGEADTLEGFNEDSVEAPSGDDAVIWWVMSQVQWLLLIAVVPAFAAALRVAFASARPNYAEMWVFSLYFTGQTLLVGTVFMAFDWIAEWPEWVGLAIPAWIFVAACLGYFAMPWPGRLARTLLALAIAATLVAAFLAAVMYAALQIARATA